MTAAVPQWFLDEIVGLYDLFPHARLGETVPYSWWQALGGLPQWAVRKAFRLAPREAAQGQYLPSAETVRRIAEVLVKHPPVVVQPYRPMLPACDVDPADTTPSGQLAYRWHRESIELNLRPDDPTPPAVAQRRLAELRQFLLGSPARGMAPGTAPATVWPPG